MKKILFLLFATCAMHGQTYQNPTFGTIKTKTASTVTTTPHLGTVETDGTISKITPENLPVSTATTNALDLKTTLSAGAFSGFAVTNNGDGTISVGSGIAYLRATNDQYAPLIKYPIAAYNNIPLVDNLNNYIVVSYNGGSPALVLNTTGIGIDTQTTSIAIAAARVGTTVHYISLVGSNSDPNAKLRNRYLQSEGIRRVAGLAISATGRKIATTAGITYSGLIRLDVAEMDTNVSDTYTLAYNNGSTWTRVTGQTDINNTQYNDAGTLTALSNNNFRTDYIYALVNSPSKLYVILGNTQYNTIGAARLAPTPSSLPVELEQLGVLVGRAIIEKDAVTMEMASPFVQDFAAGTIENHNDLAGLQGGLADQRNHLTDAQVSLLDNLGLQEAYDKASDITTTPELGAVTIRRGSVADTDNILVGQNGTGTNTFSVTGNGNTTSKTFDVASQSISSTDSFIRQNTSTDWWKIYGYHSVDDNSEMVLEVGDNGKAYADGGQRFRFHYDNSGGGLATKDPLIIDYNDVFVKARLQTMSGIQSDMHTISNSTSHFVGVDVGLLVGQSDISGGYGTWIQSASVANVPFPMSINPNGGNVTIRNAILTDAPTAPTPTTSNGVATKGYVDNATTTSGTITTATNITNTTLTDSSLPQNGKTLYISNGATNINYTVNGSITASFVKGGTGSITFVQGSGRTMVAANGTLVFNGAQYSTASVVSFGTTDIVYINNF